MHSWAFGVVVVAALLLICWYNPSTTTVRIGLRDYQVIERYKNHTEAAAIMDNTNKRLMKLFGVLQKKYRVDATPLGDTTSTDEEFADYSVGAVDNPYGVVETILKNYDPDRLFENDPIRGTGTSYTVNKGEKMYVCVRDKTNPEKLVDEDTYFFVVLHEVAHIGNYSGWGHGDDFWTVFKFLLYEAQQAGVYKPVNYEKYPVVYCGLDIRYQPLADASLPNMWS